MRVDQNGVACYARDLRVGHALGARRLGRDRKNSRSKKWDGEPTESAQGKCPFKMGLS